MNTMKRLLCFIILFILLLVPGCLINRDHVKNVEEDDIDIFLTLSNDTIVYNKTIIEYQIRIRNNLNEKVKFESYPIIIFQMNNTIDSSKGAERTFTILDSSLTLDKRENYTVHGWGLDFTIKSRDVYFVRNQTFPLEFIVRAKLEYNFEITSNIEKFHVIASNS